MFGKGNTILRTNRVPTSQVALLSNILGGLDPNETAKVTFVRDFRAGLTVEQAGDDSDGLYLIEFEKDQLFDDITNTDEELAILRACNFVPAE